MIHDAQSHLDRAAADLLAKARELYPWVRSIEAFYFEDSSRGSIPTKAADSVDPAEANAIWVNLYLDEHVPDEERRWTRLKAANEFVVRSIEVLDPSKPVMTEFLKPSEALAVELEP